MQKRVVVTVVLLSLGVDMTACVGADDSDDIGVVNYHSDDQNLLNGGCGVIESSARLERGAVVTSCNGEYAFGIEHSGALTFRQGSALLFTTGGGLGPYGTIYDGQELVMQATGDLVFLSKTCLVDRGGEWVQGEYRCADSVRSSERWSLNRQLQRNRSSVGGPNSYVEVADEGLLVLHDSQGAVVWRGTPSL